MATILRCRYVITGLGAFGSVGLLQTYWRPGTSPGSTADATDVSTRANQAYFGLGVSYQQVREVDALDDATGALTGAFTSAALATVFGSASGDQMPAQTAYVVKATTNLLVGPRLLKGRTFFAGPTESINAVAGVPSTGSVTGVAAGFTGMLTGGGTASFPVIWHRPGGAAAPVGTSGPVISYQVESNYWGSQRGRRF